MMMYFIQSYLCFLLLLCYKVDCSDEEKPMQFNNETVICSANKLVVQGYDVKISFVVNASCFGKVKFIEVFALNNLCFDVDLDTTGRQVQLSLIAPIWIVIDERQIILNGKNGDEHKSNYAPDGIGNFRHGKPGKPGGSAGKFFGIAYSFIGESNLKIYMNGGAGGPGQHGGKGIDGINGEDPPIPKNSTEAMALWESLGFLFNTTINQNVTNDDTRYHYLGIRVFGRNPTKPGDGGHGGVGGIGGYAGTNIIVTLNGQQIPSTIANPGYKGSDGTGGTCGNESRKGFTYDIFFRDEYSISKGTVLKLAEASPVPVANCSTDSFGVDGIDGYYDVGIEYPDPVDLINPTHVINHYKNFVRRSIVSDCFKPEVNLMEEMDSNKYIRSLYNTLGLIDEMMGIETQYFDLKQIASPIPYFISLLNRTENLAQNFNEPIENKGVLTWLYTAIMMRISTDNGNSIVDLLEYLNEIEADIIKLRHNEIELNSEEERSSKISEIRNNSKFLESQIFSEIENVFVEISSHVCTLIHELYERQFTFVPPTLDESIEELILTMYDDTSYYMGESVMIGAENETIDRKQMRNYELLKEQLDDIERELYVFSRLESESDELKWLTEKVVEVRSSLADPLLNYDFDHINHVRDELISIFEIKQSESQDFSSFYGSILATLYLREVNMDFYKDILWDREDTTNETSDGCEMDEAAAQANLEIKYIYDTILDNYFEMETSLNAIRWQPIPGSYFELQGSKLKITNTIRDVRAFFRKLGNETSVVELLCRSIGKLDDVVVSFFESYDYSVHFNESITVNRPVSIISTDLQYSPDDTLNVARMKLEKMIQTNIIIEKYQSAVKAFEKQYFPFANKIMLSNLELPAGLQPGDNEKLARVTIDHFYYLKSRVKSVDMLIGKYDRLVLTDIEFNENENSLVGSFFRWSLSGENEEKRQKLLRGEEIELTASIENATALSAVKFNEIGIKLITDEDKQCEFLSELEKCIVTMTMIGSSQYRCGNDIHSFAAEENVSFTYSFKRDSNGNPVMQNHLYGKVRNSKNYYLSPYTRWKIQIQKLRATNLTKFGRMTVELFGRGQYIQCVDCISEMCDQLK